ncbi:MAG: hypothetical protein HOD63_17590 [Bacteroidetes bacterium]|jgi:hypothetical protein|nr:hypothetical protein [Bacteroidota bacterium]MBT5527609.1 hypothetical protein [Cytophagia bacterium]MBT3424077.1 hypothetical protein [Bacteroidota bacterium]MBT3802732.1 hypothetical protein [Bacteroidota bacterium]MBT3934246.1 hypothetical protein [Bacteroidota bacterium]
MKSLILVLSVIFMLSGSVSANKINDPEAKMLSKTKVIKKVKQNVDYPQFAIEQDIRGDVYVSFTLNNDGSINIAEIHSTQVLLKEYVSDELEKITLKKDFVYPDESYIIKFKFDYSKN